MADPPSATHREDEVSILSRTLSTLGLRRAVRPQASEQVSTADSQHTRTNTRRSTMTSFATPTVPATVSIPSSHTRPALDGSLGDPPSVYHDTTPVQPPAPTHVATPPTQRSPARPDPDGSYQSISILPDLPSSHDLYHRSPDPHVTTTRGVYPEGGLS
jgi:hypothetical protein